LKARWSEKTAGLFLFASLLGMSRARSAFPPISDGKADVRGSKQASTNWTQKKDAAN